MKGNHGDAETRRMVKKELEILLSPCLRASVVNFV